MRWALLFLWLLGAGLYAAIAFISSHSDRASPPQSAAAVPPNDPQKASRINSEAGAIGSAPSTQAVPNDSLQRHIATSQKNGETSTSLSNDLAPLLDRRAHGPVLTSISVEIDRASAIGSMTASTVNFTN